MRALAVEFHIPSVQVDPKLLVISQSKFSFENEPSDFHDSKRLVRRGMKSFIPFWERCAMRPHKSASHLSLSLSSLKDGNEVAYKDYQIGEKLCI
jgi:hypothetical protein